jgi:CheY-like chemotaxis protein
LLSAIHWYIHHNLIIPLTLTDIPHHDLPTPADCGSNGGVRRILIADDYEPTRVLLRALIELEGMQVVGEAEDGSEAVALALRREPDVVLLDVNMPRLDGLGAAEIIRASRPGIRLLLHSSEPLETVLDRAAALELPLADKRDLPRTIQQLARRLEPHQAP